MLGDKAGPRAVRVWKQNREFPGPIANQEYDDRAGALAAEARPVAKSACRSRLRIPP